MLFSQHILPHCSATALLLGSPTQDFLYLTVTNWHANFPNIRALNIPSHCIFSLAFYLHFVDLGQTLHILYKKKERESWILDHVTTILEFSFIKKHFQHFTTYCCLITAGWQKPHKNKYETSMMSNFITGLMWTQPAQTTCTEMTKWCLAAFHFSPYVLCFSVTVNTLPAKTPKPLNQLTTDPLLLYLHSCFPAPAFKNVLRKFQIVFFF